jgi:hypothetical protein
MSQRKSSTLLKEAQVEKDVAREVAGLLMTQ